MYLYQNQSIGRKFTAPDTNCIYSKVTLSLKKSDMIKSDRFWHLTYKFKTVAGLRRLLIVSSLPSSTISELIEWHGIIGK